MTMGNNDNNNKFDFNKLKDELGAFAEIEKEGESLVNKIKTSGLGGIVSSLFGGANQNANQQNLNQNLNQAAMNQANQNQQQNNAELRQNLQQNIQQQNNQQNQQNAQKSEQS